jgi:hypothetical protein
MSEEEICFSVARTSCLPCWSGCGRPVYYGFISSRAVMEEGNCRAQVYARILYFLSCLQYPPGEDWNDLCLKDWITAIQITLDGVIHLL